MQLIITQLCGRLGFVEGGTSHREASQSDLSLMASLQVKPCNPQTVLAAQVRLEQLRRSLGSYMLSRQPHDTLPAEFPTK